MPHMKAAVKSLRQTKTRTARNEKIRDNLSYLIRAVKKALKQNDKAKATEVSKQLKQALDKAAQKNVIKKNTAARRKSRFAKKINKLK
ncbi:MAG TPA: 30S ribosomal protein S20 [bacterium]|nr:30S ribosomal protein S20 [bacterium]